jgi:hypothetical protein
MESIQPAFANAVPVGLLWLVVDDAGIAVADRRLGCPAVERSPAECEQMS